MRGDIKEIFNFIIAELEILFTTNESIDDLNNHSSPVLIGIK